MYRRGEIECPDSDLHIDDQYKYHQQHFFPWAALATQIDHNFLSLWLRLEGQTVHQPEEWSHREKLSNKSHRIERSSEV